MKRDCRLAVALAAPEDGEPPQRNACQRLHGAGRDAR